MGRIMTQTTTNPLLEKAIAALPAKIDLYYVDRNDTLDNKMLARAIGGDRYGVEFDVAERWRSGSDGSEYDFQLEQALTDSEEREALRDDDAAWNTFLETCDERDQSDVVQEMLGHAGREMIRVHLFKRGGEKWELPYVHAGHRTPKDEVAQAKRLARITKLDYAANEKALIELVQNAVYGEVCVLFYADISKMVAATDHLLKNKETGKVRLTFTDPFLLIYDGVNGSGHDARVNGTITVEFKYNHLDTTIGVLQLDCKDAGTGYSWSEDIAGVVKSAYTNDPKIELLPEAKDAET